MTGRNNNEHSTSIDEGAFLSRCVMVKTGTFYGLTQDFIKRTRERFKRGDISYHRAMLMLKEAYSNNVISFIGDEK